MLEELKRRVLEANIGLVRKGLVILTWGNVSGIDRESGLVAIKPSGVPYDKMREDDIVLVELETGKVAEGNLRPSSDTPTHLELYRNFREIGGVAHTHSKFATILSQMNAEINPFGTTHADHFGGTISATRRLTEAEIRNDYERNTGRVIVEKIEENYVEPMRVPAILVYGHGPFTWGHSAAEAAENAEALEFVAEMAYYMFAVDSCPDEIPYPLLEKHFSRKHGPKACYGQRKPAPVRRNGKNSGKKEAKQ